MYTADQNVIFWEIQITSFSTGTTRILSNRGNAFSIRFPSSAVAGEALMTFYKKCFLPCLLYMPNILCFYQKYNANLKFLFSGSSCMAWFVQEIYNFIFHFYVTACITAILRSRETSACKDLFRLGLSSVAINLVSLSGIVTFMF